MKSVSSKCWVCFTFHIRLNKDFFVNAITFHKRLVRGFDFLVRKKSLQHVNNIHKNRYNHTPSRDNHTPSHMGVLEAYSMS